DQRVWERLKVDTPLLPANRILCLAPFRGTLALGKVQIVMLSEAEVRVLPQSTAAAPAIEVLQGRILLPAQPPGSLRVGFGDRTVNVDESETSSAALERSTRLDYGRIITPAPALAIYSTNGEVPVSVDKKPETLAALDVLTVDAAGAKKTTEEALPSWANDPEASKRELQTKEQFARLFHPDRPILAEIVVASED